MVPSHPTILIGFGRYGRSVMRRLLQEALDQGALVWDEPTKEDGPGSRCLRNLAFIHVSEERDDDSGPTGDLARDLYSQIREVTPEYQTAGHRGSLRMLLADAVTAAKDRLLDASGRLLSGDRLRVGLDVVILAQPGGPEASGRIEDLLEPAMETLADDRSLERPSGGINLLNFVLFLDFDSYWESPETNRRIRAGLQALVERWHTRQVSGRPGFARIYLMDGQVKEQGRRSESLRVEELIILLCLMLFEGKRDDPGLRGLFEKPQDDISPLATFGIRALEQRHDLLGLLSAARFASGWLDYLMGNTAPPGDSRQTLRERLGAYRPESLEFAGARQKLDRFVAEGIGEIEREAYDLSAAADGSDWREEYSTRLDRSLTALKNRLSRWSGEYALEASSAKLTTLSEQLNEIVSEALDDSRDPLPSGLVTDELLEIRKSLEVAAPTAPAPGDAGQWDGVARAHGEFNMFRSRQLNPANLPRWWPLLAAAMAGAWTPVVLDALNAIPPPAPGDPFPIRQAYALLRILNRPFAVVLILMLLAWAVGSLWFEPQMRKWLERGFLGWFHKRQGKLPDRIGVSLGSSAIAEGIRAQAEYVYKVAVQRVNTEVRREIDRVVERLRARNREMLWLRDEMREFLRTHGIDPDAPLQRIDTGPRAPGGYRVSFDRASDLQRTLALNPPNRERYLAAHADKHPLRRWLEDYCDTFLYPVIFLEDLSKSYYSIRQEGPASGNAENAVQLMMAEMEEFLRYSSQFPLAFDWSTAPGAIPDQQTWCILPVEWKIVPRISAALHEHAFIDQRIVAANTNDRAYFLKVQWGVSVDRLTRHDEWQASALGSRP